MKNRHHVMTGVLVVWLGLTSSAVQQHDGRPGASIDDAFMRQRVRFAGMDAGLVARWNAVAYGPGR